MLDGFGGMGIFGIIVLLLFFVAVVLLVVWAVRTVIPSRYGGIGETPMAVLKRQYAAAEINQTAFDRARRVLDGHGA